MTYKKVILGKKNKDNLYFDFGGLEFKIKTIHEVGGFLRVTFREPHKNHDTIDYPHHSAVRVGSRKK